MASTPVSRLFPSGVVKPVMLSDAECFTLAACLLRLPGQWLAQRDEDEEGQTSVVLFAAEEDVGLPALAICRDPGGYSITLECEQHLIDLGCLKTLEAVLRLTAITLCEMPRTPDAALRYWTRVADYLSQVGCREGAEQVLTLCYDAFNAAAPSIS